MSMHNFQLKPGTPNGRTREEDICVCGDIRSSYWHLENSTPNAPVDNWFLKFLPLMDALNREQAKRAKMDSICKIAADLTYSVEYWTIESERTELHFEKIAQHAIAIYSEIERQVG